MFSLFVVQTEHLNSWLCCYSTCQALQKLHKALYRKGKNTEDLAQMVDKFEQLSQDNSIMGSIILVSVTLCLLIHNQGTLRPAHVLDASLMRRKRSIWRLLKQLAFHLFSIVSDDAILFPQKLWLLAFNYAREFFAGWPDSKVTFINAL